MIKHKISIEESKSTKWEVDLPDLLQTLRRLIDNVEKLIEENKRIVSEISVLTNAERIEKIAVEELGMHKAEAEDIVRVEMTGEKK